MASSSTPTRNRSIVETSIDNQILSLNSKIQKHNKDTSWKFFDSDRKKHSQKDSELRNQLINLISDIESLKLRHPSVNLHFTPLTLNDIYFQNQPFNSPKPLSISKEVIEPEVEISVECSLSPGESLAIRGSGALETGIPLIHSEGNTYRARLKNIAPDQDFKIQLNGQTWERGESHRIRDGRVALNIPGREGSISSQFIENKKPAEKLVVFTVKIDLSEGETIALRGSGTTLNWGRDVPLEKVARGTYQVQLQGLYDETEFKFVLNGRQFEEGANHRIKEGSTTLNFSGRAGEITVQSQDFHPVTASKTNRAARRALRPQISRFENTAQHSQNVKTILDSEHLKMWSTYSNRKKVSAFCELVSKTSWPAPSRVTSRLLEMFKDISEPHSKSFLLNAYVNNLKTQNRLDENYTSLDFANFVKQMYDTLPEEMKTSIRWNIYLANEKSSIYQGVDRGDIGQYIIENAFISPLCKKAIAEWNAPIAKKHEEKVREKRANSFLLKETFQKWNQIRPNFKYQYFVQLIQQIPTYLSEKTHPPVIALFNDFPHPLHKISLLHEVNLEVMKITRQMRSDPNKDKAKYIDRLNMFKSLSGKLYEELPSDLKQRIAGLIPTQPIGASATSRTSTHYVQAIISLLNELKKEHYLSQYEFTSWDRIPVIHQLKAFKKMVSTIPFFNGKIADHLNALVLQMKSRIFSNTEPRFQVRALLETFDTIHALTMEKNKIEEKDLKERTPQETKFLLEYPQKREILTLLAKEIYKDLPVEMQKKIKWQMFVLNKKSTTFKGAKRDDLGEYIIQNHFISIYNLHAIRAVCLELYPPQKN